MFVAKIEPGPQREVGKYTRLQPPQSTFDVFKNTKKLQFSSKGRSKSAFVV